MGQPKALLSVQGKPLIAHLINQLSPLTHTTYIAARDKAYDIKKALAFQSTAYQNLNYIDDYFDTDEGPLSAIAAGLQQTDKEWLWITSTDCFGQMIEVFSLLTNKTSPFSSPVIFLNHNDRLQPMQALIHQSLADDLIQTLESGQRAVIPWYKKHHAIIVEYTNPNFYSNLNTPDDYNGLLSHLSE
jgi:molybdopterin-guanine dinucleotide biosynthesis protein A